MLKSHLLTLHLQHFIADLMDTEVGSILGGNVALIPVTTARTMEEGIITD